MKLKGYVVSCAATGRELGRVLAYNEYDALKSAAAYGWIVNVKVRLS